MRAFSSMPTDFFYLLPFSRYKGPKGPKCDLWGSMKYSFFIQFWWDFFHLIPLNESFQNCYCRFLISLTVFKIQGAQKGKNAIFEATSKFYFSSDFDEIFFIEFLWMRSFRIVQPIFSISYRFRDTRGPKRAKTCFSVQCNLTAKHITLVKHIIVSNTLECQTHYCVEQVLEAYLFLCTHLLSTCCGRIMLRLRSPSVFLYGGL